MVTGRNVARVLTELAAPLLAGELMDALPDTVFFIKDAGGRYVVVNATLVERCGRATKADLLGRTVAELFPPELARVYSAQDQQVIEAGESLQRVLELHFHPGRRQGWCVTSKYPLRDPIGRIVGLVGISRDVPGTGARAALPTGVAEAVAHLHEHYAEALRPADLARRAGMTQERFAEAVRRVFHVTPRELVSQVRLDAATRLLRESEASLAEIAHACGFYDHSAFSRQFRAATGVSPSDYRKVARAGE